MDSLEKKLIITNTLTAVICLILLVGSLILTKELKQTEIEKNRIESHYKNSIEILKEQQILIQAKFEERMNTIVEENKLNEKKLEMERVYLEVEKQKFDMQVKFEIYKNKAQMNHLKLQLKAIIDTL